MPSRIIRPWGASPACDPAAIGSVAGTLACVGIIMGVSVRRSTALMAAPQEVSPAVPVASNTIRQMVLYFSVKEEKLFGEGF